MLLKLHSECEMSNFVVNGGKRLSGKIAVSGSKNAALPIIFATMITRGVSVLHNVPNIKDVRTSLAILESFGADVSRLGGAVRIDTAKLFYNIPDERLVSSIRASSYLLGASLSRFNKTEIRSFGGCNFDNRPIDMHIAAMRAFGAVCDGDRIFASGLFGADIHFNKISVGATVNALILSASANGVTRIYNYAKEPHVIALIEFLVSAGADIRLCGDYIEVHGKELHGGTVRIIPDMIEAGTFLMMSVATDSRLDISFGCHEQLDALYKTLMRGGVSLYFDKNTVKNGCALTEPVEFETSPYPGFATDLHPIMAPLLANAYGGVMREGVWQSRFGYLSELSKFGVEYTVLANTATVFPSKIVNATASATDLRGGAALLTAALIAKGESVIRSSETVGRGYENIAEKLRAVGADIIEI